MKSKFIIALILLSLSWPATAQLGSVTLGGLTIANSSKGVGSPVGKSNFAVCAPNNYYCFPLATITYTFTGSGNWSVETNWLNNIMPPTVLQAGTEIIINGTGQCILNVQQTILADTKLTIMPGKKLVVSAVLTTL